jgi:hypothetical protein
MGMNQNVVFPGEPPSWPAVAKLLADKGCPVQMRMIDGELAFPDETPPDTWREIRVAAAGAMVTIRRQPNQVVLVAWGNADDNQRALWNALAATWAEAGGGIVQAAGPE